MTSAAAAKPILIVEDDIDVRESLTEALNDFGYATRAVHNGAEALAELRAGAKPVVILLDLMMPIMDGREFRDRQREDPELSGIPVIVLSANAIAPPLAEEMRALRCLQKPVKLADLLSAVADACEAEPG